MSTKDETFDRMHELLALEMIDRLENGDEVILKGGEGEVTRTRVKAQASTLNVIRQFLRDNKVEGVNKEGTPLNNLARKLPFDEPGDYPN